MNLASFAAVLSLAIPCSSALAQLSLQRTTPAPSPRDELRVRTDHDLWSIDFATGDVWRFTPSGQTPWTARGNASFPGITGAIDAIVENPRGRLYVFSGDYDHCVVWDDAAAQWGVHYHDYTATYQLPRPPHRTQATQGTFRRGPLIQPTSPNWPGFSQFTGPIRLLVAGGHDAGGFVMSDVWEYDFALGWRSFLNLWPQYDGLATFQEASGMLMVIGERQSPSGARSTTLWGYGGGSDQTGGALAYSWVTPPVPTLSANDLLLDLSDTTVVPAQPWIGLVASAAGLYVTHTAWGLGVASSSAIGPPDGWQFRGPAGGNMIGSNLTFVGRESSGPDGNRRFAFASNPRPQFLGYAYGGQYLPNSPNVAYVDYGFPLAVPRGDFAGHWGVTSFHWDATSSTLYGAGYQALYRLDPNLRDWHFVAWWPNGWSHGAWSDCCFVDGNGGIHYSEWPDVWQLSPTTQQWSALPQPPIGNAFNCDYYPQLGAIVATVPQSPQAALVYELRAGAWVQLTLQGPLRLAVFEGSNKSLEVGGIKYKRLITAGTGGADHADYGYYRRSASNPNVVSVEYGFALAHEAATAQANLAFASLAHIGNQLYVADGASPLASVAMFPPVQRDASSWPVAPLANAPAAAPLGLGSLGNLVNDPGSGSCYLIIDGDLFEIDDPDPAAVAREHIGCGESSTSQLEYRDLRFGPGPFVGETFTAAVQCSVGGQPTVLPFGLPIVFALGLSAAPALPLPGSPMFCDLHVSPDVAMLGAPDLSLALAPLTALAGIDLHVQAVVLDAYGLLSTDSYRCTIGIR